MKIALAYVCSWFEEEKSVKFELPSRYTYSLIGKLIKAELATNTNMKEAWNFVANEVSCDTIKNRM